jgi:hypothetical protein
MFLEYPLSKYQSSQDEALRDVWAIILVPTTLGFHSFLVLIITWLALGCVKFLDNHTVCNNKALYDHIYHRNDISKEKT